VIVLRLIAGRIVMSVVTLLLLSVLIFAMIDILPGDVAPRILGRQATPETLELLRERFHLNDPAVERYLRCSAASSGDFGTTLTNARPIGDLLAPRLVNTAWLSLVAFCSISAVAHPWCDQAVNRGPAHRSCDLHGHADLPVDTGFPAGDFPHDRIRRPHSCAAGDLVGRAHLDRRGLCRGAGAAGDDAGDRHGLDRGPHAAGQPDRGAGFDYVRMAEFEGPVEATGAAAAPPAQRADSQPQRHRAELYLPDGGVVIIERVFAYPGFGSLLVDALQLRDVPLIEATVLIAGAVYVAPICWPTSARSS
jgi:peptide/nickel transport system permease protein